MLTMKEKHYHNAMLVVLGLVAVIILLTFRHYGITWDEELQSQYGLAIVDYYLSFFKDDRYAEIYNLYLYGGMFDGLASIFDRYTPFHVYDTRHLLNALFGLLGLWGTWRLARLIDGGAAGLMALVLLLLTPMYYGHMFNNPKDIPFAVGVVWTIYYMGRCLAVLPNPKFKLVVKTGVLFGLMLGIRIGGIMALGFWGAMIGWIALLPFKRPYFLDKRIATVWRCGWRVLLPVGVIAYAVMLACWPWAQQSPVLNPLHAFNEFRHFPQDVEILLDGTIYMSTALPRYYVPLYFAVQLPEALLFLLAVAGLMFWHLMRDLPNPRRQIFLLSVLMCLMPIIYAMAGHPALYDAVRHFLFAVPLMCAIAGVAGHKATTWATAQFRTHTFRKWVQAGALAAFIIAMLPSLGLMIALHPYEYIYANAFAGGVPGAYGKYEMDYWGSSFKEAARDIEDYVDREGGVPAGQIFRIAICGPWDAAMIYLPPNFQPVEADEPAEFFLSTTRWMCQNMRMGKEIVRISRLNVPLAIVKDLRNGP
ncbi:MAG: glycosyltransferase family 39 protein [Bdellovibrionales bacterium]